MNESIDSISSFFNKLLNIKGKDQSSSTLSRESYSSSNQSKSKSTSKTKDQMKTSSKLTLDSLKAGLSDILDETSDYLNSITSVNSPNENRQPTNSKKENDNADKVHLAIDLTNEQDAKSLLECAATDGSCLKMEEHIKATVSNKPEAKLEVQTGPVNEKKDNLVKKTLKNENFLSIQLDDKVNERNTTIEGQQTVVVSNKDLNRNSNEKSNDLNRDDVLKKSILNIESNDKSNGEKSTIGSSIEKDYLPENVCFIMPDLFGTSKGKFEEINLLKDVKEEKENLNANKEILASKEDHSKNGKKADEEDHVTKDQTLSKQEIDEKNSEMAQFPKSAKIFFQKSSKNESSGTKSKLKNSLFNVIKSDKSRSNDKSNEPKSQSKTSLNESSVLANADEYLNISKISIKEQNLSKVKKSASFSSTTSLATSSTSSDNANIVGNKENDCELLSEFNDAFKNNYLINQINQTFKSDQLVQLDQTVNKPTTISLSAQHFESQPALNNNCPPKPPSRTKSTSKLNKTQNDLDNVNSSKKVNSHESTSQSNLSSANYSTIKIVNQPLVSHSNGNQQQLKSEQNSDENKLIKSNLSNTNYSENETNSFNLTSQLNKLTISVQANDKQINLEQTKLVNNKNDYQLEQHMKSDLEKEQTKIRLQNALFSNVAVEKQQSNGLWSSSNDSNKENKRKNQIKFNDKLVQDKFNVEQQVVKRSKTTHLDTRRLNSIIKTNHLDKSLVDKTNSALKERSVNESIDKLVNKSLSRLANRRNQDLNYETVRNKSCSSLYQTLNSAPNCELVKPSRIPLSKSSVHLSKPDRRSSDFILPSYSDKVLTDNCLDVSSSSTCSLCTTKSLSTDSLESLAKKDSSRSSSLNNLNSSSDNCDFNRLKTSSSTPKMISRPTAVRFGAMNYVKKPNSSNYSFMLDGTRSLSNLTSYQLMNYNNRKLLKTNSNHHFYPIRELSRIDESIDDDQEQQGRQERNLNYVTKFRKDDESNEFKFINSTNQSIKTSSNTYDSNAPSSNSSFNSRLTNQNSNLTFTNSDTNSLISSSLDLDAHCMDHSSDHLTINKSSNSSITNTTNTTNTSSTKPSLNQFKSSLINQLIDSNSHLKNNICIDSEQNDCKLDNQLNESLVNFRKQLDNELAIELKQNDSVNDNKLKDGEIVNDDLSDSTELSVIENLNEAQKSMFNSKKNLFAKNKASLISKDSCRSFELNERIVELEMQLMSHKTKFKESLNLIKLLSDHCNDLIEVFNENYNCKLNELSELINENQRLIKLNQQIKLENINLNETCDDLRKHLNRDFAFNLNTKDDLSYKEQYRELEEMYQEKTEELNNLKAKFKQNNELYERVKSKAMEKVESANKMIENANLNKDRELMLIKMQLKKAELKCESLSKENSELNQLLDNLK